MVMLVKGYLFGKRIQQSSVDTREVTYPRLTRTRVTVCTVDIKNRICNSGN